MTHTPPPVAGYTDQMSYRPGDRISVHASGAAGAVAVRLVRLGRGIVPDRDQPAAVEEIAWDGAGTVSLLKERSCVGGFGVSTIRFDSSPTELTLGAWIWPTAPGGEQVVIDLSSAAAHVVLSIVDTDVVVAVSGSTGLRQELRCPAAIRRRTWSSCSVQLHADRITLRVNAIDDLYGPRSEVAAQFGLPAVGEVADVVVAAQGVGRVEDCGDYARGWAGAHFEGKIAAPFIIPGLAAANAEDLDLDTVAELAESNGALWDLAPHTPGSGGHRAPVRAGTAEPMVLVNAPLQGVTGPTWDGSALSFRDAPRMYSAVHFHSTDLVDCGWTALVANTIPDRIASGIYGIELRTDDGFCDTVPIFVTPALGGSTARTRANRIAFVAPTFTYVAYGNEDNLGFFSGIPTHILYENPEIRELARSRQVYRDREFGASLYDRHPDGSGVHISSSRRPMLDCRPETPFWAYLTGARGLGADMYLIEWLERNGYGYDVVTDLELHREGVAALAGYDAVLTGSHPEYSSGAMLDAYQDYRDQGGHLAYLGGNGFYWVTGVINEAATALEIRRGHVGIRTWASEPGENNLASTWEPGGLWRFRGRAPQRLVGVGMAAQGGTGRPYRIDPAAREQLPWAFEGIDESVIGDFGWVDGGAAGDEVDRADADLGTPPGAVVLGSSFGHPEGMQRAAEELLQLFHGSASGPNDPEIRADLTYFETPSGGSVFSTGSISFLASILVNDGDNSCSRLLHNVVEHFLASSEIDA